MIITKPVTLIILFMAVILVGQSCSHSQSPIEPTSQIQDTLSVSDSATNNRLLWGLWLIAVDPQNNTANIIPLRQVQTHWNVLKWLEQGPCTNCVQITSFTNSDHGTKYVDIKIKHPFQNLDLTGFDIRGIAMFNGSHLFPTTGLTAPNAKQGDGELINAEGYTRLYNFSTVGKGPNGLQGYLKGKFATATIPNAKLNGFMRFLSSKPGNTRSGFYAGDTVTRTYDIDMPGSPFVMGYAVDASWVPATSKPVDNPMTDFPPEANCQEPYAIVLEKKDGVLYPSGGAVAYYIDVYDYQGNMSGNNMKFECPELFNTSPPVYNDGDGNLYFDITNVNSAPVGKYKLLIYGEDPANATSPSWLDLTAYQIYTVEVIEDYGWARTWGGTSFERAEAVYYSPYNTILVAGEFQGIVDFDPGPGTTTRTSVNNSLDAYLSAFNTQGQFIWVKTWGGPGSDVANDVADSGYYIDIVGYFEETVDFNPGSGTDNKTSSGEKDAYVLELYAHGGFNHVWTYGGSGDDEINAVVHVDDEWIVAGSYEGFAQLPHGSSTSKGGYDAFVGCHNPDSPTKSFGGTGNDYANGLTVSDDAVYVTGEFQDGVFFKPPSTDYHLSNGQTDVFIVKYTVIPSTGSLIYAWSRTWGSNFYDYGKDVSCNPTTSDVYAGGIFCGTVNFNTGPSGPVEIKISSGLADAFVCSYDKDGYHRQTVTWGGNHSIYMDGVSSVSVDGDGNVYVSGGYVGSTLGFTSNGIFDCILVKYNSNLSFTYARSWGGSDSDNANDVFADQWGRTFTGGYYRHTVDFNPGSGVDNHSSSGGTIDAFLLKMLPDGYW